ncbi:hypothetical protein EYF80_011197 [Liparis tanakae]|uniref:Uncharacterized protein n=1 Tax=Liparis tanakae TaxID=230148 RepID=A0A4Z2IN04_9TELE|nr:hypothetical protein EYF80_011197 [Liparis tanakae]
MNAISSERNEEEEEEKEEEEEEVLRYGVQKSPQGSDSSIPPQSSIKSLNEPPHPLQRFFFSFSFSFSSSSFSSMAGVSFQGWKLNKSPGLGPEWSLNAASHTQSARKGWSPIAPQAGENFCGVR